LLLTSEIVGSIQDQLVLVSDALEVPKRPPVFKKALRISKHHTYTENVSSAHVHLADSYALLGMDPIADPAQILPVPRNSTEAQSSEFATLHPSGNLSYTHRPCNSRFFFTTNTLLPSSLGPWHLLPLPGTWLFTRKRNRSAFLHLVLNDFDLYIHLPSGYLCSPGNVLKLQNAIHGIHWTSPRFKKEVTDWLWSTD
jgi:hypothetical protein